MARRRRKNSGSVKFSLFVFQDIITCVMGIMLLLTLMLCLQIVTNPGIASESLDAQAMANLSAASTSLKTELQALQKAIADNAELLESGGLIDVDVLNEQKQRGLNSNQQSQQNLQELAAQTKAAQEAAKKLQQFAKNNKAVEQTKNLTVDINTAQRILEQLEQGQRVLYNRPPGSNTCWLVEVSTNSDIQAGIIGKKQPPKKFPSIEHCRDWMLSLKNQADFLIIVKPETFDIKAPLEKVCRDSNLTYAFDLLPAGQVALDPQLGAGI